MPELENGLAAPAVSLELEEQEQEKEQEQEQEMVSGLLGWKGQLNILGSLLEVESAEEEELVGQCELLLL